MFHVLIVEDEKTTRDGLCKHINWSDLKIHPVSSVSNGMEALRLIETIKPDILLSDIKMPHMNGIELATIIRKKYPKCKIIFLSGYADKEYLMSAIKLKAANYIEKPVDLTEIQNSISKAVEQLLTEQEDELIHNSFQQTLPIANQEIVSALIRRPADWEKFERDFIPLYFHWNKVGDYSVLCIKLFHKNLPSIQIKMLLDNIDNFLNSHDAFNSSDCFSSHTSNTEIVLILRNANPTILSPALEQLQKFLLSTYSIETIIALSGSCMSLLELPALYQQTTAATEFESFYHHRQCILTFTTPLPEQTAPAELFSMKEINISGIENLFSLLNAGKYTNIHDIRTELFKLYIPTTERTWSDQVLSWGEFESLSMDEYQELLFYELNVFQLLGNGTYDIKIKNAIHFILWNYPLTDLSVKMIADNIGLSQNYLSTLFKKQTGITINGFIANVRSEKACSLLSKTDLKLYEISGKIGLQDPNYLSSIFKKQYGMTPSQYRQSISSVTYEVEN